MPLQLSFFRCFITRANTFCVFRPVTDTLVSRPISFRSLVSLLIWFTMKYRQVGTTLYGCYNNMTTDCCQLLASCGEDTFKLDFSEVGIDQRLLRPLGCDAVAPDLASDFKSHLPTTPHPSTRSSK
ncbi:hypothetical protein M404DRAFT_582770 [Pisolithus tinctorius Marx 270]|uniref:Uncharacterized protein n=1 Tax=Pisolithus tinctorius Marx 270 TaxID=870435 RepID=A0A0C3PW35_PISTI|nr:hypothetical protein M404DRAFT_582770 [Pisolithus tinctorius Marx 270]